MNSDPHGFDGSVPFIILMDPDSTNSIFSSMVHIGTVFTAFVKVTRKHYLSIKFVFNLK